MRWSSDKELFDVVRRDLFSAVVGDIMDKMGFHRQFLPPQVRPLHSDMVVVGRAMTVLEADISADHPGGDSATAQPFGLMFRALDDLKPDEVYICTGASPTYALWGELMSTRAMQLGAAGAVLDGYSRDTKGILALNFPTFSIGSYAQDQAPRGKVIDFRVSIEIGSVHITPGDIVVGDLDGVCIVPQAAAADVFDRALEKASTENMIRKGLLEGMSATEAFAKYGVM
jgi:regulator of RNase E activity RraA